MGTLPAESGPSSPIASPYRGLASFTASDEDAALFFGRDRDRDLIIANLLASRLTLLYGQSGVGKSSILCAGVVNRLRQPAPSTLAAPRLAVVYVSEWHGDPCATIRRAIQAEAWRLSGREWQPSATATTLADTLATWSTRLDAQLLLVLDQFEQHFVYHPAAHASRFDDELAGVLARRDLRLRCLIALREDALVGLDRFKDEIPQLFENRLRLDRLTAQAARAAIERPLDRLNELRAATQPKIVLEQGLAEEIVRQLSYDIAPLSRGQGAPQTAAEHAGEELIEPAHLQLVMQALWVSELAAGSTCLRARTLVALGGCARIVRSYVESALDGLPPKQRAVAARAIRYLVTPSGTKIAHTATDLSTYAELPRTRVAVTLERMSALRVLRPLAPARDSSESRYEVFHDLLAEPVLNWATHFQTERLAVRARWLYGWLIAAMTAVLAIGAYTLGPGPLQRLELRTIDARFNVRGPAAVDRGIVIVELDTRSLRALDGGRYPNLALRARDGELIDRLLAGNPKAIAYDVEFTSAAKARYENPLLHAIARARKRIVLASSIFDQEGDVPLFGDTASGGATELLGQLGARAGYSSFPLEAGGIYRRVSYGAVGRLLSFAVTAADIAAGHPVPHFGGWALINYRGPPGSFPTVSMIDVLDGRVPPSFFAGKIVVVGVSAPMGEDLHPAPFSSRALMPGAEVQANAIATVQHGPPIWGVGATLTLVLIVLCSFVPLLALSFAWWAALTLYAGAAGAYLLLAQLLFDAGLYLPVVYPLLALSLASAAMLAARCIYAMRQPRHGKRGAL